MSKNKENISSAIAAFVIMGLVASGYFVLPPLLNWLSEYSVWLSYVAAALFVLAFSVYFGCEANIKKNVMRQKTQATTANIVQRSAA